MAELLEGVDLARMVTLADFEPLAFERMSRPAFDYVAILGCSSVGQLDRSLLQVV